MGRAVPGRKPVVLVVEDENLIRLSALDMVEEAGFEAIAASDADEAIRILESRNDIRAVFTDVQCPAPWTASGWRALLGSAGLRWL